MPWTSWKFPGTITAVNRTSGNNAFVNPSNVSSDNGVNSTSAFTIANFKGHWLWAVNFGFSAGDIPSGAQILGLEARAEINCDLNPGAANLFDRLVCRPISVASLVGTEQFGGTIPQAVPTLRSIGGQSDKMGSSISRSDILDSTSGMAFSYDCDTYGTNTIYVDYVQLRVFYSDMRRRASFI